MKTEMRGDIPESGRKAADVLRQFSARRIALPVLLGLGVVYFVVYKELMRNGLSPTELITRLQWSPAAVGWLLLGLLMLVVRDAGYVWQLRILTDRRLSWRAGIETVVLWNFFAAVSPSMVGGAAVAVFMLRKEGLSLGRSTAIVFTTVFFDQCFFISIPFVVSLIIPQRDLFAPLDLIPSDLLGAGVYSLFWSAWSAILAYVLFLIAALFVAPGLVNRALRSLFQLRWLARWRRQGLLLADELLTASRDLTARPSLWWWKAWAATSVAWFGRYLVLNCVLAAFSSPPMGPFDHILAAGRQAVLWIIMLISPTPGASGIAEIGFSWLFRDLVAPQLGLSLAILWRLISYYPYLLLGIPVMTRWIKRHYGADVRELAREPEAP